MSEIPWFTRLVEGCGVNPDTFQTFRVGIEFDPPAPLVDSQGQTSILTMKIVNDTSELASSLNVSASASLTTLKGGGSVEAKFLSQKKLNAYYTYSLVKVYVENPPVLIRKPTLTKKALEVLESGGGWDRFSQFYGLEYVQGYVTGGIYYALIEVRTTDAEEKREISAKLSGNYRGVGYKLAGGGEAENKMQEATQNKSTSVYVLQSAGSGDLIETNLEDMIKQAQNFPQLVKASPVHIRAIINSYKDSVEGVPINVPNSSVALSNQKRTLEGLGRLYMRLRDYDTKLEFVSDNLNSFDEYKDLSQADKRQKKKDLSACRGKVSEAMRAVIHAAEDCVNDSKQCQIPKLPDDLFDSIALPEGDLMTDLPTRINGISVTVPTNSSSLVKLQEYDVRNQNRFEVAVKLSTAISESQLPGTARFIGLGISSTKSGKTVSIVNGITSNGRLLIANASGDPNPIYRPDPGNVVYLKITRQAGEFDLLFSRDGLSFESLLKSKLTALGFPVDDTYKVFLGGNSTDSTPISGKFSDLIIT